MPRYFFDTYVGRFSWIDRTGRRMTRGEVEASASIALADAVRGALPEMPIRDMSVNVRDEGDIAVFAASVVIKIRR